MNITPLSEEEKAAFDKQIEELQDKAFKAKHEYDAITDELSELLDKRYP